MYNFRIFCTQKKKKNTHTHTYTLFLFYTPTFTKRPHQSIYSNICSIKYSFLLHYHLSQKPNTTHPATIINPPSLPASIIKQLASIINPPKYPFNPATTIEIQIPIQPSYHQWNPNIHLTQPVCNKIDTSHLTKYLALIDAWSTKYLPLN